jgi:ferric-dicitrate binding protein FerR (iron transport regulator)
MPVRPPSPDLPSRRALAACQAHERHPNRRVAPALPTRRPSWRERATAVAWWLAVALAAGLVASGEPEPCSCCHSLGEASENALKD